MKHLLTRTLLSLMISLLALIGLAASPRSASADFALAGRTNVEINYTTLDAVKIRYCDGLQTYLRERDLTNGRVCGIRPEYGTNLYAWVEETGQLISDVDYCESSLEEWLTFGEAKGDRTIVVTQTAVQCA